MKKIIYQLKNMRRDKLCIISFLLPIIAGLAINLLSGANFSSLREINFCIVENDLSDHTIEWLQINGCITVVPDITFLRNIVNDPATQAIGVIQEGNGIQTLLSGDELKVTTIIGNTLPQLYSERNSVALSNITIVPAKDSSDTLTSLLIVITMVTAMFMGCTFNAMNIIGEKEDGIVFVNEILPMKKSEYIIQKISLGFLGGTVSTILTACVCLKITAGQVLPLLLLIVLSAFTAALVGLFIGRLSSGLMTGIAYIKVVMILFLAPPILFYLVVPPESVLYSLSYLLPSSATFYGLMSLLNKQIHGLGMNILILLVHCIIWLLLFYSLEHFKKNIFCN